MSDPIRLQNRLSNAFDRPRASVADAAGRTVLEPPPLAPEAAFEVPPRVRRTWEFSPYLFGGLGLVASAAALAIGHEAGFYAVVGGLGSVGAGAVLLHALGRAPSISEKEKVRPQDRGEARQDALWRRDESAAIRDSVHDALGDIVVSRDLEGRIVAANTVFCRLAGTGAPQGQTCEALGFSFVPAGQAGRFEVTVSMPRGPRLFLWHDVTVRDERTGVLMVRSLARDVTEERQLARDCEEALRRAEAMSEAKSRLLATVSHEIRTPLGGILGMVSLLGRTRLSPEQASYLDGIRQSGEALGQLVDELLDFSSIEAGRFKLNPLVTEIRPLIEGVSEMLAYRAHGKGLEIAVTVDAGVPEQLEIDAARLRQVLFNLIGNAVKFTATGGVLVSVALERSELVVAVSDTGPGMDAAAMEAIFDEFSQTGDAGARSGGTGLGLSISARLATALGGSLSVSSRMAAGSTFTLRLPVRSPAGAVEDGRAARLAASRVLLLAPAGPAARATVATLETLGAHCRHVTSAVEAAQVLEGVAKGGTVFTDIIVDHRLASAFTRTVPARQPGEASGPRRIFLVNPEERTARGRGDFDAWLIRPLREKSLTDVLTGRLCGLEKRGALNDNCPLPGFAAPAPEPAPATGLSVLLAEDDPVNAMLARSALEKAGHRVSHVGDFEAVLAAINEPSVRRPDLLVTDLSMPGGEGSEVIASIRAAENASGLPRLPVLVLTADKRRQAAQRALSSGADAVLEKPAAPERLVEVIAGLGRDRAG